MQLRPPLNLACGDEAHFGFFDAPVHARSTRPDLERLLGSELVAESLSRFLADVGHGVNEMHKAS